MNEWLRSLVGYMLIVSVALQMLPKAKYEQYLRLFTGIILLILMLQPFLKIGGSDRFLENKIAEYVRELEDLEERIFLEGEKFQNKREKTEEEEAKSIEVEEILKVEVNLDD